MRFGDYEVLDTAGTGATGTVYRARDVRSGEVVAVKVLSPDAVAGMEAEAATLRRLQHPHLVRLLETGTAEDGRPWLAQAWVDGVGLDRLLQVHGALTAEQGVGVLRGALEGLAHAHAQGVVHRDVAPGNVLVDMAGTSMLVDFGVAAPVGATGVRGTPAFLSPEAASGAAVGPASDVYSAGAVLHLLLAGQPVFPSADLAAALEAHRSTPPPRLQGHGDGFADLVQRCLAKQAAERPPDAGALLHELDEQADRRFGTGWLARASVAALVPGARAAGSSGSAPAAGAARETVVLTTGAVSTGAAAVAPSPSTAPAAAAAPVQPPPSAAPPSRVRVPRSGPALAAIAVAAVVVIAAGATAVVALSGDDEPTGDAVTAGASEDPSGSGDPTSGTDDDTGGTGSDGETLSVPIGAFCDQVDQGAAAALVGPIVDSRDLKPGDPIGPGGGLPTMNFGCTYAAEPQRNEIPNGFESIPRLVELRIAGAPATEEQFSARAEGGCAPDSELSVEGLGELVDGRLCTHDQTQSANVIALLGEALFVCSVERPVGELDQALAERTVEFCVATARTLAGA